MTNNFEEAFGNFLERREYDQAENALFSMVRISFVAGWLSAGGEPPQPQRLFEIFHNNISKTEDDIETNLNEKL